MDTPRVSPHGRYGPEAAMTGGEAVVRALAAHGVRRAFGIPGTHNLEIYRHLEPYGIGHVTPRHEQGAGYAADAYARVTGRPGVAVTTTGPALLNIAAAAGQAYSDSVPLLIVSPGMPLRHPRQPTGMLHEMRSQTEALRGVAAFSHRVSTVEEISAAVARAFTLFRTERPRPVHIEVPLDLLEAAEPVGGVRLAPPSAGRRPGAEAVREAAAALLAAERPALVLGGGARGAAAECLALAEELGAWIVTTANGKGVVDESHPLSVGVSLHSPSVRQALTDCDVVLAVGTELAESDLWSATPLALGGALIRVDVDPAQMYAGLPADVALVGDARAALGAVGEAVAQLRPTVARGGGAAQASPQRQPAIRGLEGAVRPRGADEAGNSGPMATGAEESSDDGAARPSAGTAVHARGILNIQEALDTRDAATAEPAAPRPAAYGPASHGPGAHGAAAHGPASHGPAVHGAAAHGPAAHAAAAHGPSAQGPAAPGLPAHGAAAHEPAPHGPAAHGPSAHGPATPGLPAHGPAAHGPSAHGPATPGLPAQGPSAHGLDAHRAAAHGPGAHGPAAHAVTPHGPAPHGPAVQAVAVLRGRRDGETAARDVRWVPYLRAIRGVLDEDAVITSDSAQCCYYGALPHLPVGPRGRYLHPTGFGTLGYALPAAIGAKSAYPGRHVVALSGDGGLQFTVQELATAAQLGHPLPVVVFDNGGYGEIRDEMNARGDTPTAVDLPRVDLPALCRAYGGEGMHAASPGALADALARALKTPGPTVITVPEETTV